MHSSFLKCLPAFPHLSLNYPYQKLSHNTYSGYLMILKLLFINALIRLIFKNKQKNKALSKSALSDFSNALNKCNSFILV